MDYASQWPQGIISGAANNNKPIVESTSNTTPSSSKEETLDKRANRAQKGQQQQEANLNCPRCNSTNTKFCYYNNYSLSQPRYFCKTCRRYWTHGGSLRNVPVGGGSRKNKRSSSSPSSTSSSKNSIISTPPTSSLIQANPQNPNTIHGHDLNLAYDSNPPPMLPQNPSFTSSDQLSLGNFIALNTVPPPGCSAGSIASVYPPGGLLSSLQGLKPTLHYFSLDNNNNWFGSGVSGSNNGSAQERASGDDDGLIYEHDSSRQQGDRSSSGYSWNSSGMFGGGSWQL